MYEETPVIIISPPVQLPPYLTQMWEYLVSHFPQIFDGTQATIGWLMGLSIPICLLFAIGIILSLHGLHTIRRREDAIYNKRIEMAYDEVTKGDPELAHKWDRILALVESDNESDWRQSIIEADIILGDILKKMGYKGETIGEQMSRADKGDFKTISQAGEAHHVRNQLAHVGAYYPLSQYEARRVISLYRTVFEEFFFI